MPPPSYLAVLPVIVLSEIVMVPWVPLPDQA